MKKIVFTGGGTAGHVSPNLALIPYFMEHGYEVHYIGSEKGIEKSMIESLPDVKYHSIRTGKLRRYLSFENVKDFFRVSAGIGDAKKLLKEIQPDVIFSKGGFVSVPVCFAAKSRKIPLVCHESDITPGLANKLSVPCAKHVCVTFKETLNNIKSPKGIFTGTPIRPFLFTGSKEKATEFLGFTDNSKPTLLIMGGSLGSKAINNSVRENLSAMTEVYNIIHLCGKNNLIAENEIPEEALCSYRQYEFISDNLNDLLALADVILSRAGSNAIHEFLAIKKPMILIPLSGKSSRGDQILNAENFKSRGLAEVLPEEAVTSDSLLNLINRVFENRQQYLGKMNEEPFTNGTEKIISVILDSEKNHA